MDLSSETAKVSQMHIVLNPFGMINRKDHVFSAALGPEPFHDPRLYDRLASVLVEVPLLLVVFIDRRRFKLESTWTPVIIFIVLFLLRSYPKGPPRSCPWTASLGSSMTLPPNPLVPQNGNREDRAPSLLTKGQYICLLIFRPIYLPAFALTFLYRVLTFSHVKHFLNRRPVQITVHKIFFQC